MTKRIGIGSAIMNILCNGGPIAAAERVKTFLALHGLDPAEKRLLTVGFASGRFPFINIPYGIVPRNAVEEAAWPVVKNKIFEEATEILTEASGFREKIRRYEEVVIKRALAEVNGSVTHAASLLQMNYQSLAYIIENRHPHLLTERTPVRRRPRKQ